MNYIAIMLAAAVAFNSSAVCQTTDPEEPQVTTAASYSACAFQYENRWGITLTPAEIDMLARIVKLEAGNQDDTGQQLVVAVIFNRMVSEKDFGGPTLEGVLSRPGQFSTWKNQSSAVATSKEYDNIFTVLHGASTPFVTKCNWHFFDALGKWGGVKIGDHYFR